MCDYSLHNVASRPAKIGDRLVTTDFYNTLTAGFSAIDEPSVAVCLLPGTEIAFEAGVQRKRPALSFLFFRKKQQWTIPHQVGRFRQINMKNPSTHHDAIEFPDGQTVLLTRLKAGQRATVLQLPVRPGATIETPAREPAAHSASA